MSGDSPDKRLEDAKRLRVELRLALAQADELMRKAQAVLLRSQAQKG
jgi:hypothetical protein